MIPPTLQEVSDYFRSCSGSSAMAEAFYNRYQANGWTVGTWPSAATNWVPGRKAMKNWRSAVAKWIAKNQTEQARNRTYQRA